MQLVEMYPRTDLWSSRVESICLHRNLCGEIIKENCLGPCCYWKRQWTSVKIYLKSFGRQHRSRCCPKNYSVHFLCTFQHLEIQEKNELLLVKRLWAQRKRVYPGVQFQVLVYTRSLLDPCRIERFLIWSVQFCRLAAGCVCCKIGLTIRIWPSKSIEIRSYLGSWYEVVSDLVGSDTTKLSCYQFLQTLTGFRWAFILRGVGFREIASQ